ncbi:MAG: hypothetical protein QOJ26_875 [Thermoplasmata archaeon]|jgi:glycogen(starch) synthase|nr:hypothetical protein [Thermoplasmata archaeon]
MPLAGDPLRIAVFANALPPLDETGAIREGVFFGGVERASWNLTRELARRGLDVWVFSVSDDPLSLANDLDLRLGDGAWHHRPVRRTLRIGATPVGMALFRHRPGYGPFDVVLAYMGDQPAPLAALRCARRWKVPLVVSFHGDSLGGFGSVARRTGVWLHAKVLGPLVMRHAAAIIALSKEAAASSFLVSPYADKTHVIPNGVAPVADPPTRSAAREALGLRDHRPVALFAGSLMRTKGVDRLLQAWAGLEGGAEGPVLLVAGEGPDRGEYEALASRLGIADRVRFLGFVPLAGPCAAADVFVLPSRTESFPLTLLEAAMAGRPLVVSSIPTLRAMVEPGVTGLVVDADDEAAFARDLGDLLRDRVKAQAMGQAAHRWAKAHTWPAVAAQTEAVLRGVAARARIQQRR